MQTPRERIALEAFANDDMEPLEEIVFALRREGVPPSREELLALLFGLCQRGLVEVRQCPIMGQQFAERQIVPSSPSDVIGDLEPEFDRFWSDQDYLRRVDGGGVPFGIYLVITESGRSALSG